VSFEDENIFFYFVKTFLPTLYTTGVVAVNSKVVGLASGFSS
jgi:hypothetical protein